MTDDPVALIVFRDKDGKPVAVIDPNAPLGPEPTDDR